MTDEMTRRHKAIAAHIEAGQRVGLSRARLVFRESPIPWETREYRDGYPARDALPHHDPEEDA